MTPAERDAVIDECIKAVLSVRSERDPEVCAGCGVELDETVEVITGAACFRLMQLRSDQGRG